MKQTTAHAVYLMSFIKDYFSESGYIIPVAVLYNVEISTLYMYYNNMNTATAIQHLIKFYCTVSGCSTVHDLINFLESEI